MLQKEIVIQGARALRYYQAYDMLMEYFNYIPDEDRKEVNKKLQNVGL